MEKDFLGNREPMVIENRQFVEYEEEDIQHLNDLEEMKFVQNPQVKQVMDSVEKELGEGHWEKHWLTIDPSGRRIYARIYYGDEQAQAVTSDGKIIKEINY